MSRLLPGTQLWIRGPRKVSEAASVVAAIALGWIAVNESRNLS